MVYAADPYHGEHQVCHEEYQTQAYKVPLVTAPLTVQCSLAYPAPKEVCVTKDITITEVGCEDKVENKCFNVAKFVDATNTVDQRRSSSENPAVSRSPSPSTPRPAGSSTTRWLPTPSPLSTTPPTTLCTTLPPSTTPLCTTANR